MSYTTTAEIPRGELRCDVCRRPIPRPHAVVFALQEAGAGPCPGQSGWYVATAHVVCCPAEILRELTVVDCRSCGRPMHIRRMRNGRATRRRHCSNPCRQADYRERREVYAAEPWTDRDVAFHEASRRLARRRGAVA